MAKTGSTMVKQDEANMKKSKYAEIGMFMVKMQSHELAFFISSHDGWLQYRWFQ